MFNVYKNEQSGRSMVEMLGVLAIIGVLSIGGISGYSKAMAKYRVNKTLDQISMLVMNIRALYASSINYSGLNNQIAIQMGIIPKDMMAVGTTEATGSSIINAYQGGVFIKAGNTGGTDRSFTVQYSGLTREACVAIATADWGSQAGSGLVKISVGASTAPATQTTEVTGFAGTYDIASLPVTLAQAAANCKNASTSGNPVQWEYY